MLYYVTWDLGPYLFKLGPVAVRYYGPIFLLTILGGYYLWRWQARRAGLSDKTAFSFAKWVVVAAIAGARLGHCIFYDPVYYFSNPVRILLVWQGGLASHGAAIGITLAIILLARKSGLRILETGDRFSFSIAVGAAGVRLGNFFNSAIVGRPSTLPWAVKFPRYEADPVPRHPSQLYEFVLGLAVLGVLMLVDRFAGREKRPEGILIGSALALHFLGRFGVEFVKEYQVFQDGLTMGQWLSLPGFAAGVGILFRCWRRRSQQRVRHVL